MDGYVHEKAERIEGLERELREAKGQQSEYPHEREAVANEREAMISRDPCAGRRMSGRRSTTTNAAGPTGGSDRPGPSGGSGRAKRNRRTQLARKQGHPSFRFTRAGTAKSTESFSMTTASLWEPTQTLYLRPYQVHSIEELRDGLTAGLPAHHPLRSDGQRQDRDGNPASPGGPGQGSPGDLRGGQHPPGIRQTSKRFVAYGIPHGYVQGKNTQGRGEHIQVAMAQTIEKRGYWNSLDLLIIDECHIQHKKILQFARGWGGPVIGLSATPLTKGLSETYQHIVNSTTTDTLLAEGWLAPLRIYAATEIDMAGASKDKAGEWTRSEVRNRGGKIVGDIVSEYAGKTLQHFGGPVKTLVFSADVAHGEELCRAFQAQGYDFRQSTYHDSDADTDRLVKGFRQGEFTGLVSVAKFVKGFDVKDVLCGIDARPNSSSLSEVIQKMGRVMRSSPGKDYGLWLDHAGNMAGWYDDVCDIWENGVERLPDSAVPKKSRKEGRERQEVVCLGCKYVLPPKAGSCPYCGKPRSRARTSSTTVPGRMEEWARSQPAEWMKDESWVWSQLCRLALERTNGDSNAAQGKAAGYYKGMYSRFPKWGRPLKPCDGPVDERVSKRVQHNLIRYRYAKSRRGA